MVDEEISERLRKLIKEATETGDAATMFKGMRAIYDERPLPYSEVAREETLRQLSHYRGRWARLPPEVQPMAQQIVTAFGDLSARAYVRMPSAYHSLAEEWQGIALVDNQIMGRDEPDGFSVAMNPKMSNASEVLHDTLDMLTVYGHRLAYLRALRQLKTGKVPRLKRLHTLSIKTLEAQLTQGRDGLAPQLLLGDEYYHMRNAIAHGGVKVDKRARRITFTSRARGRDKEITKAYSFVEFVVAYKHLAQWMVVFTIFKAIETTVLAETAYQINLRDATDG